MYNGWLGVADGVDIRHLNTICKKYQHSYLFMNYLTKLERACFSLIAALLAFSAVDLTCGAALQKWKCDLSGCKHQWPFLFKILQEDCIDSLPLIWKILYGIFVVRLQRREKT